MYSVFRCMRVYVRTSNVSSRIYVMFAEYLFMAAAFVWCLPISERDYSMCFQSGFDWWKNALRSCVCVCVRVYIVCRVHECRTAMNDDNSGNNNYNNVPQRRRARTYFVYMPLCTYMYNNFTLNILNVHYVRFLNRVHTLCCVWASAYERLDYHIFTYCYFS